MDYLLVVLLSLAVVGKASQANSESRKTISDSFDVNIGAGYGVGPNQLVNNLPRSTTKIVRTRDYPPNEAQKNTLRNIREPRILTNFTPVQNSNVNLESKSQSRIYDFTDFDRPPSNSFEDNNLKSYRVHESFTDEDKYSNARPSLIQLQKVISGVDKPHSKIIEVIKVPAVYEIHLQSNAEKDDHKNSITGSSYQDSDSHIKIFGKYKPIFNDFSTKFSDDYIKWLKSYYKKKEEDYVKEREKFYEPVVSTPQDFQENLDDLPTVWNNENLQQNEVLEPVLAHHFQHIGSFENKHDKDITPHSANPNNKLRYSPWQEEDHTFDKDSHYNSNNIKDVGLSNYKSNSRPFRHVINKFPQTKKSSEIYKLYNKVDIFSKPTGFKRNQEITEFNQPQALHEVPAPYLGNQPPLKGFQRTNVSISNDFVPQQSISHLSVHSSLSQSISSRAQEKKPIGLSYNQISESEKSLKSGPINPHIVQSSEHIPSKNGNEHFIYGKRTEPVLAPSQISITETTTTQRSLVYKDNYRRSDYDKISNPSTSQRTNSDMSNSDKAKAGNYKSDIASVSLTTTIPDASILNSQNNTSTFNKKSDNIGSEYSKKDIDEDAYSDIDSWDMSKYMKPVYKSNFFSIYPKKTSEGKKNLLYNVHSTDYGRNIIYNNQFKDNMSFQTTKGQNQSKEISPVGYVIYITKKTTEKK